MTEEKRSAELDELAINTIRTLAMDAVEKANSGHPGAPMGLAPLGYVLWTRVMRHNPKNPRWPNRDRFVLSNGHACMLQYALLHLTGYGLPMDEIKRFRQWDSKCPGHPEYGHTVGIEVSTGPLGQGFGNGVGFALAAAIKAERFNRENQKVVDHTTWVVCGDGDMEEGVSSEAASLAGNLGLGNLVAIYDDNEITIEGSTALAFREKVGGRFDAYGWSVHQLQRESSLEEIELALREAQGVTDRPSLVILPTHIGYGSPNKQDTAAAHGAPLGDEEVRLTKENLGWPPDKTFYVPDEVKPLFAAAAERGAEAEREWSELYESWAADNPELAEEFERLAEQRPPKLPPISQAPTFTPEDDPIATRSASGKAINWLAPQVPELLGGAADLAPSTATYIDDEPAILHHAFRGRNLHFGVREHSMGTIVNALTIEGIRAYGATFFTFSDYMRGAVRMAALMRIPSIFIYTHDSIFLGEDGPTHQPIEHLASLRAMPQIEVIRPADVRETFLAWHWLLERTDIPTALVLTRQKLPVLDPEAIPDDAVKRGAYVLRDSDGDPDLIVIGTGSEVSLSLDAADLVAKDGAAVRVVSMPCAERFLLQDEDYRESVLPSAVTARLSVEAGSPLGWARFVGRRGASVGIDHFGASAPAADLAEHFGFTPEAVAARARELL